MEEVIPPPDNQADPGSDQDYQRRQTVALESMAATLQELRTNVHSIVEVLLKLSNRAGRGDD
jgi:hypothetical protein